jgi:hypothetical protein
MTPKMICINFLSLLAIIGICLLHLRASSSPSKGHMPLFGQVSSDSSHRVTCHRP